MKCETENLLSDNYTYFKYKSSIFSKKVLYRIDGDWIDLSDNSNLQEYKMGDLSSSFLVRKRDDWWFRIVLDFETKEIQSEIAIIKSVRELYCKRFITM